MSIFRPVLLAGLIVLLGTSPLAFAQETPPLQRTVQVMATGTVTSRPDRVRITVSVETSDKAAREASRQNAARMAQVVRRLQRADLPKTEIRTLGYSLNPRYEPSEKGRRPEPVGYVAANTLQVTADSVDAAGALVDAMTEAGANRVTGLAFELRDPDDAYLEALRRAMASARRQAEALASAAGQTLWRPLGISASDAPRPLGFVQAKAFGAGYETPIEIGEIQTSAGVTVTYQLSEP